MNIKAKKLFRNCNAVLCSVLLSALILLSVIPSYSSEYDLPSDSAHAVFSCCHERGEGTLTVPEDSVPSVAEKILRTRENHLEFRHFFSMPVVPVCHTEAEAQPSVVCAPLSGNAALCGISDPKIVQKRE